MSSRIERERKTVTVMIELYCQKHHRAGRLCVECAELSHYASSRLDRCPYQEGKTTCAKCPVHCFQPEKRERIRTVMRYSGPRMMWHHPVAAIRHLVDERRERPVKTKDRIPG
jgi:hypothetical protein